MRTKPGTRLKSQPKLPTGTQSSNKAEKEKSSTTTLETGATKQPQTQRKILGDYIRPKPDKNSKRGQSRKNKSGSSKVQSTS